MTDYCIYCECEPVDGKGPYFYKYLMDNNYPEGLQIMCMNCNWARSRYGVCPHQNPMKQT